MSHIKLYRYTLKTTKKGKNNSIYQTKWSSDKRFKPKKDMEIILIEEKLVKTNEYNIDLRHKLWII